MEKMKIKNVAIVKIVKPLKKLKKYLLNRYLVKKYTGEFNNISILSISLSRSDKSEISSFRDKKVIIQTHKITLK